MSEKLGQVTRQCLWCDMGELSSVQYSVETMISHLNSHLKCKTSEQEKTLQLESNQPSEMQWGSIGRTPHSSNEYSRVNPSQECIQQVVMHSQDRGTGSAVVAAEGTTEVILCN
jgi:hypothetical protein